VKQEESEHQNVYFQYKHEFFSKVQANRLQLLCIYLAKESLKSNPFYNLHSIISHEHDRFSVFPRVFWTVQAVTRGTIIWAVRAAIKRKLFSSQH